MTKLGRDGYILYNEEERDIKIYWEASGVLKYNIIFSTLNLKKWSDTPGIEINIEKQLEILHRLRKWLKENKIKSNIEPPKKIIVTDQHCHWKNCKDNKIEGSAFCLKHFDFNLLVQ